MRKRTIIENEIYHICNKSISNFRIFSDTNDSWRFIHALDYYNNKLRDGKFSKLPKAIYVYENLLIPKENTFVKFI